MSFYLPSTEDGYLPIVVFLVGLTALGNVIQCYTTLSYSQRIYTRTTVTPLSARTFGTWNLVVGIGRLFAAYHMNEPSWYTFSLLTNVIGLFHFGAEAFVYKTCVPKGPWFAPVGVATTGLVWHVLQYGHYLR